MDNGEEIPLLNEEWSLMGLKMNELMVGVMVMMLIISFTGAKAPSVMPLVFISGLLSSLGAATLRRQFPDEERGVRNYFMVAMGFSPPGIPTPSVLQPYWSGGRARRLKESTRYMELGLDEIFTDEEAEDTEA